MNRFTAFNLPRLALLVLGLALSAGSAAGQDQLDTAFLLPRKHHAWGKFEVGSWKKVRVTTETLNEQGEVIGQSVADTTTRLVSVDGRGYSLRSETTIQIGGRQLGTQVSTLWQGFGGENADDQVSSRLIRPASMKIGAQAVDTQVREFVYRCNNMRRVSSIHYSPSTPPHVLQGQTIATDPSGQTEKFRTDVEVLSLNLAYELLDEKHQVAKIRTVHQTPKSKVVTHELFSDRVPGGIVANESEAFDLNGRVVSRSSLELVDFGTKSEPQALAPFGTGRFRRARNS